MSGLDDIYDPECEGALVIFLGSVLERSKIDRLYLHQAALECFEALLERHCQKYLQQACVIGIFRVVVENWSGSDDRYHAKLETLSTNLYKTFKDVWDEVSAEFLPGLMHQ